MSSTPSRVRGTRDLLPEEARCHRLVVDLAREQARLSGFAEIQTPILESLDVFCRTLGADSDVVHKEMYVFPDRKGDQLCLRPENTASVVRAFLEARLESPQRFFYHGPMFRYERPQAGRQRQFSQIGVELLGLEAFTADIEVIATGVAVLEALKIKNVHLEMNSLGTPEDRVSYRERLVAYMTAHRDTLSKDSRARLESNPLRILDSKDAGDRSLLAEAPQLQDSLCTASVEAFQRVCSGLDALGISWTLNPHLVRGLDYYCHTTFEFTSTALGAQATVMAGGRYDGLIRDLGGPDLPGVGWAAGIERLMLLAQAQPPLHPSVIVLPLSEATTRCALEVWRDLKAGGISTMLAPPMALKKGLRQANRVQAAWAVMVGEDELAAGQVLIRNLETGEQHHLLRGDVRAWAARTAGHAKESTF